MKHDTLEEYSALRADVEAKKDAAVKAAARYEHSVEELCSTYGVRTIKEAKQLLAKLEADEHKMEEELREEVARIRKEWSDVL